MFTENEGWFQQWGQAISIRTTSDVAYSVAEWFAGGGAYHAYYMWHGGNNYGRTAASGVTTLYADDVCLHSDGTPNEPKYTQLSRLQHLIADHAEDFIKSRFYSYYNTMVEWKSMDKWYSTICLFLSTFDIHFVINQADFTT